MNVEPRARGQVSSLATALAFAFTTGGTQEAFDRVVGTARLADSDWTRDCFADDLFLKEFVRRCMPVTAPKGTTRSPNPTHRLNLLCQPAPDLAGVRFRQAILTELVENDSMYQSLLGVHQRLHEWRRMLDASYIGQRLDPTRRRLDILLAIQDVVDTLAQQFHQAASGLGRLSAWARRVQQGRGYRHLCELFDHEGHIANVEVNLRIGHGGDLRSFEVVRVTKNRSNPLWVSPIKRVLLAIAAFFGGPRVREAEVLSRMIDSVFDELQSEVALLFGLMADIEFYIGAIELKRLAEERGLAVCIPELFEPGDSQSESGRRLDALFNPFLLFEDRAPVPCDIRTDHASSIVIVTGPNSGGKTRLIQSIAMAQLLAQSGLFVPARQARLPWAGGLFASLSTPPTADQKEGRLGTELLRIRRLFERVQLGALVVLDELCSGTNPSEGEEIFELVLSLLAELDAQAFITTHFLQFAERLAEAPPSHHLEFLQVTLDGEDRPTYQFSPGVATTSLARQTAQRLGVTREELSALIRSKREVARRRGESAESHNVGAEDDVVPAP